MPLLISFLKCVALLCSGKVVGRVAKEPESLVAPVMEKIEKQEAQERARKAPPPLSPARTGHSFLQQRREVAPPAAETAPKTPDQNLSTSK